MVPLLFEGALEVASYLPLTVVIASFSSYAFKRLKTACENCIQLPMHLGLIDQ